MTGLVYTLFIFMSIIFVTREISAYKTIKGKDATIDKMSDKLMAKDFREYHDTITPLPIFPPVSKDDEDLYLQEIEDNKM